MPELPEVEVSKMGITPHIKGQSIDEIIVRQPKLRWMIPEKLQHLKNQKIMSIERRAKYLLLNTEVGSIIIHLGMSGSLRVLDKNYPVEKHDHVDLILTNGKMLRYNDPRRFGAWLWQEKDQIHELLSNLGPEPLDDEFCAGDMFEKAKAKKIAVKQFIMDNKMVVGVGNIYANESLFSARIHPQVPAGELSLEQWNVLTSEIKQVLAIAIQQGGTTLKDFNQADGKPGYFKQELKVYGRGGQHCVQCDAILKEIRQGQRTTVYCSECQR